MDRKRGTLTKNYQEESKNLQWVKVIGVGNSGAGKTCLIKHFCESKFSPGYQPTVGVDYGFKIQTAKNIDLRVHLWDLSGSPEYIDVRNELYTNTDAVFLVYDITNQSSFDNLEGWLREIYHYAGGTVPPEVFIVGNKSDMRNKRVVSTTEAKKWAISKKLGYYETSASNGDGVDRMFSELMEKVLQKRHIVDDNLLRLAVATPGST